MPETGLAAGHARGWCPGLTAQRDRRALCHALGRLHRREHRWLCLISGLQDTDSRDPQPGPP